MTGSSVTLPPGVTVFERGWLSSNNVLLTGRADEPAVLIDSGYCTHGAQTLALLRHALGSRPLQTVINTHLHSDHCGGNALLQRRLGASVCIPPGEAEAAAAWDMRRLSYQATGQSCERFRVDAVLEPGSALAIADRTWQVLAAPGHDPHSIVLFSEADGLLVSADALWENGFGVVFPEIEGEQAFDDVQRTLDLIARLNVRVVIPGHGSPFCQIDEALERAYRRLQTFKAEPERHGWYAGKALTKFHLLEVQQEPLLRLLQWLQETRYFRIIRQRYFSHLDHAQWSLRLVEELKKANALDIRNGMVFNT